MSAKRKPYAPPKLTRLEPLHVALRTLHALVQAVDALKTEEGGTAANRARYLELLWLNDQAAATYEHLRSHLEGPEKP